MPQLPESDPPPSDEGFEPSALSRLLLAQIGERMRECLDTERQPRYCVIRCQGTQTLSVLASSTLGHDQDIVWGPQSFAACCAYVNSDMARRQASRGGDPAALNPEETP